MTAFPHLLERTVDIGAPVDVVFEYFTDNALWAAWWGPGSAIDARPGGRMLIRHNNGIEVTGEVVDVDPPRRIVFTYGYASSDQQPKVGGSQVTIALEPHGTSTRLSLTHAFAEVAHRGAFVQGWRFQLSVFATVLADRLHAGAADTVDAWFGAWSNPDGPSRDAVVAQIASADVRFRDRYSLVQGHEDLQAHLAAVHRFMPGMAISREGAVRHCQGVVVADWIARSADGAERGRGQNVFTLAGDGRIVDVVGLWM
ncbi:MAG: SRPBCC family protein [Vicinamibacteraceae bacterium]